MISEFSVSKGSFDKVLLSCFKFDFFSLCLQCDNSKNIMCSLFSYFLSLLYFQAVICLFSPVNLIIYGAQFDVYKMIRDAHNSF